MAQSYDVYFARMILTLGLVEREAIQGALNAYQQAGGGIGFPRWLAEHRFMEKDKVQRVAQELERWFVAERRRAQGYDEPVDEKKPPIGIDDDSGELAPDEES